MTVWSWSPYLMQVSHPREHPGQQRLCTPILRNSPALGLKCRGQASGCANWPSIQSTFMEGLLASKVLKVQKWIRSNFSLPGAHGWNLSDQEFRGRSSACPWGHCKLLFWCAGCPEKRGQVNRQRKNVKESEGLLWSKATPYPPQLPQC